MPRIAATVAASLMALGGLVTQPAAAAATHGGRARSGDAPVSEAAVAGMLQRATGYRASQLTTRAACGAVPSGRIRCYARVLTLKSSGRAVTPRQLPDAAGGQPASTAGAVPAAYSAAFLQSAYDTTWLSANDGASDTVAIVDAYGDSTAYSDMEQFRTANGLAQIPTCGGSVTTGCFEVVNQSGSTTNLPSSANDESGDWNIEESLDIDAVSTICPNCKILVVEAKTDDYNEVTGRNTTDLETAVSTAARLGADQISLSWGADERPSAAGNESPYSSITGAAVLAASGDGTYPGPKVGYPAALPSVTAVGGTALSSDATAVRGYDESAWSVETCSGNTPCATESGCDTSQAIPAFQNDVDTGCSGRAYNDISADADPRTGLDIYDSQSGDEGCGTSDNWCVVGGTSLATPLTAALEAVTGVASTTTPAWTYSDATLLNDIVSGSDGSCPSDWSLICNAAAGWDGPTGNGSISGDLGSGAPGLGGNSATGVNATDVTLTSGLYPNGEPTSYHWLYWPSGQSSSSGISTSAGSVSGSPLQAVTDTLCGTLSPATTYDYELVASNAVAGVTGDQGSFTTAASESAPTGSASPLIGGSAVVGQTLSGADASWDDASCNSAPSYAWQESADGSGSWTTVSTAQSYALTPADLGQYLHFTSTVSNAAGSTTLSSAVAGPVAAPSAAVVPSPAATPATGTTTDATSQAPARTATTTTTVRFYRCAATCRLLSTHGARTYKPQRADWGRYIKVVTTISRITGNTHRATTSTRWVGPVSSATAGSIALGSGARVASLTTIKGSSAKALAQVRVSQRSASRLALVVRSRTSAPTRVWAYVVTGGRVVSCTAPRSLTRPATLTFALKRGQRIRLVAVRT